LFVMTADSPGGTTRTPTETEARIGYVNKQNWMSMETPIAAIKTTVPAIALQQQQRRCAFLARPVPPDEIRIFWIFETNVIGFFFMWHCHPFYARVHCDVVYLRWFPPTYRRHESRTERCIASNSDGKPTTQSRVLRDSKPTPLDKRGRREKESCIADCPR